MELINAKQVEWLVINQPDTEHYYNNDAIGKTKLCFDEFSELDLPVKDWDFYYLTPETYNQLPEDFKQLR